jgi:hypothetical protein
LRPWAEPLGVAFARLYGDDVAIGILLKKKPGRRDDVGTAINDQTRVFVGTKHIVVPVR